MPLEPIQYALGGLAGAVVGLMLGLFGGGGSIMAVPLLVYLVGVPSAHLAIGTSALAVAANALIGVANHARMGTIRWRHASIYAAMGAAGAFAGSAIGKIIDGQKLLFVFALLMLFISARVLRLRRIDGHPAGEGITNATPKLLSFGALTGLLSGFFGIGGGFLIVPGLVAATRMPMLNAIGSSLVVVAAFGSSTAINYGLSGWVDWGLALALILGGMVGGWSGARLARKLSRHRGLLPIAFSALVACVAVFMLWRTGSDALASLQSKP